MDIDKTFAWSITPCKAFYDSGEKKGKVYYKFYIVDYDLLDIDHLNLLDLRNNGFTKTKYFHTKKEANEFLDKYIKGETYVR